MKKKKTVFRTDLVPVLLMTGLLPLVVKGQEVKISLGKYSWFPDGGFQYDFFIYWKEIIFLILTGCMLVILVDRCLIRRIPLRNLKICVPLLIYGGLTIFSTVCSVDKTLSLKGMWQQYESVWVLLGYLVAVFYCMQVVESAEDIRIVIMALMAGAFFQGVLGIAQILGNDFFSTEAGRNLLTMGMESSVKDALRFNYGANSAYMALYTPDYAGVYLVMILPVIILFTLSAKKKIMKAAGLILTAILLICLYGSGSRTGIVTGVFLVFCGAWLYLTGNSKKTQEGIKKKKWMIGILTVFLGIVAVGAYDMAADHALSKGLKEIFHKNTYDLESIEIKQQGIFLAYKNEKLMITPEDTQWGLILTSRDSKGNENTAAWNSEKQCFSFRETEYEDLEFDTYTQGNTDYLIFKYEGITWNFYKEAGSDHYVYLNQYGKEDTVKNAKAVLKGHERALSGRGYIWGRTVPLLLNHLLLGSGPDTFVVEFPQTDYVMKANTGIGMYQQLPTKAHSIYLQNALQTGVLSLICLLVFWGRYMISFVKNRKKHTEKTYRLGSLGIFLGITGFLITGLMNDSNLAVSPVFWCLLGCGIAMETFHS